MGDMADDDVQRPRRVRRAADDAHSATPPASGTPGTPRRIWARPQPEDPPTTPPAAPEPPAAPSTPADPTPTGGSSRRGMGTNEPHVSKWGTRESTPEPTASATPRRSWSRRRAESTGDQPPVGSGHPTGEGTGPRHARRSAPIHKPVESDLSHPDAPRSTAAADATTPSPAPAEQAPTRPAPPAAATPRGRQHDAPTPRASAPDKHVASRRTPATTPPAAATPHSAAPHSPAPHDPTPPSPTTHAPTPGTPTAPRSERGANLTLGGEPLGEHTAFLHAPDYRHANAAARAAARERARRAAAGTEPAAHDGELFDVEQVGLREPPPPPPEPEPASLRSRFAAFTERSDDTGSHGFGWTMLRTTLGSLIPGAGLIGTRLTMIGTLLFMMTVVFGSGVILAAVVHPPALMATVMNSVGLTAIGTMLVAVTIIWMAIVAGTYLVTRPRRMKRWQRIAGAIVVFLMAALVGSVSSVGAAYAFESAIVVSDVFGNSKTRSQTRPLGDWANKDRVNILLLGGDSGADRDEDLGLRTDTVMLASINTHTGNTVFIQLPRNLENVPFPAGSDLAKVYPNGRVWDRSSGTEDNYMLNAVWNEVPLEHPELFRNTDQPGADATKLAVSGITGLTVDYYAMINIDGIQALVDAMGGVVVNINFPIAKGGHVDGYGDEECGVDGNLSVGPDQKLDGADAMWYARSRCNDPDYDYGRMRRQSCLVNAIIRQANPQTMLTRYEAIAAAGKNMMSTDIPESLLDDATNLALQVKDAQVSRVVFSQAIGTAPQVGDINPGNPDYNAIRNRISGAITASDNGTTPSAPASASSSPMATGSAGSASSVASAAGSGSTSASAAGAAATPSGTAENMSGACDYHPN
ncbi:Cell envelope-related transcriptional attenuator [Propionibacterium freudenreichii]|nr:Cell envelope-related transcriptional attenuator [Propionibacterium freudenreichii]SBT30133.1 Cell envelope-related transcriptional attenuator [Propionibacterium freudenreichii]SCQ49928.1 Cell envelope-related transcriptional attenuator [Propionibacterium freudenreichii]SCQ55533.1 Cell envelope-related transcriptional attenuator [Propionibacterium freudenreichii]